MRNTDFQFKTLFGPTRSSYTSLGLLVVQQLIVASSTIWITGLMQDLTQGHSPWQNLILFLSSLLLPYTPGLISNYFATKWEFDILNRVYSFFERTHQHRPFLWRDQNQRDSRLSLLVREVQQVTQQWVNFWQDFISSVLNVGLNILVLAWIIDSRYLLSFAVSLALCWAVIRGLNKQNIHRNQVSQNAHAAWISTIMRSWNSLVLGNQIHVDQWKQDYLARYKSAKTADLSLAKVSHVNSGLLAVASFVPSMSLTLYLFYAYQGQITALTSLAVVLPRLFMILNFTHGILQHVFSWSGQMARIAGLEQSLSLSSFEKQNSLQDVAKQIAISKIQMTWKSPCDSFDSLDRGLAPSMEALEKLKHQIQNRKIDSFDLKNVLQNIDRPYGRLEIQGENGSGKSTLLLTLKQLMSESAFYLPAKQDSASTTFDDIATTPTGQWASKGMSTGQKLKVQLYSLAQNPRTPSILLLDEWSANLDSHSRAEMNELIDQLAVNRLVIEVVHR